jgi:hypothetical protein
MRDSRKIGNMFEHADATRGVDTILSIVDLTKSAFSTTASLILLLIFPVSSPK